MKNSNRVFIGKKAGYKDIGYTRIGIDGKNYWAHRLEWLYVYGKIPDAVIDHINGDRGDNRIENLRDVSIANNISNQKMPNTRGTSGLIGVHLRKDTGKYSAYIQFNRKRSCLGSFNTAEEASRAYIEARNGIGIPI